MDQDTSSDDLSSAEPISEADGYDPAEISQHHPQSAPRTLTVADLEAIYDGGRGLAWPISGDRSTVSPCPIVVPIPSTAWDTTNWAATYRPTPNHLLEDAD